MKVFLFVAFVLGFQMSFAQQSSTNFDQLGASTSSYAMEPSISISSINNGSRFMSIALISDVASWLSLGVEGDLPADFERQEQFYMGRLLTRIHLLKSVNSMYLQGSGSVGFFNGAVGTNSFTALGAMFGYMRAFSSDWEFGGRLGVQYVSARFLEGDVSGGGSTFNNRLSVVGAYRF